MVWRPRHGQVRVKLPYADGNRHWLRQTCGARTQVKFDRDGKHWLVARGHFRTVIEALAARFGEVEVFVDQTVSTKCGPSCQGAVGDECNCQCLGANHGGQVSAGWVRVSEEFLVQHETVRIRYFVCGPQRQEASA